jgi:hypothetical protein
MSILRADSIRDRAGTGAPDFPNGLTGTLTGNVTGTASTATLANTATVATNAQGLTGTPNIAVGTVGCGNVTSTGDVTGVNATFSGNLTVQGTTTTIDTAVTSVDSLQIDGSLKVGTTQDSSFPDRLVSVGSTIRTSSYIDLRSTTTGAILFADGLSGNSAYRGQVEYNHSDDSMRLWTAAGERLRIKSDGTTLLNGTALFKGGLAEKVNVKSQLTGANACAITAGNVILTTSNEPGNTYPNITGVHSLLESGQGFSVTIALKVNGSGTINGFHIDGVAQTVIWSGGSAPSAGSSGHDVFTFTAVKTGSGTTNYTVFGAATNYA